MTAQHGDIAKGPGWELRCGDWRDVLADISKVDAVICDPPYSERTHAGQLTEARDGSNRRDLNYASLGESDIRNIVYGWMKPNSGWFACMTDDMLIPYWRQAYRGHKLYDFAPVPIVAHRVRLTGDGPASSTVYLMAGRPRKKQFMSWGALPGWYEAGIDRKGVIGGKPLWLMRTLVRDYSRPNMLICDPFAGGGTTLLAAMMEGRRAIGAEVDPETFTLAVKRLRGGWTMGLPGMRT